MLAQMVITGDGVAQGAILASILAGFAFVGSTTVKDRGAVVLYFAAGMLMLLSGWAGLMALLAERADPETFLATAFFLALGVGSLLFVLATVRHIQLMQDAVAAIWCTGIAIAVSIAGVIFVFVVLRR